MFLLVTLFYHSSWNRYKNKNIKIDTKIISCGDKELEK